MLREPAHGDHETLEQGYPVDVRGQQGRQPEGHLRPQNPTKTMCSQEYMIHNIKHNILIDYRQRYLMISYGLMLLNDHIPYIP